MAATKLPGIFSNGMVLQRNREIIIKGNETAKPEVVVTLGGNTVTAQVTDGSFRAVLPPMDTAVDLSLTVEGTDIITVEDVCIGDVYMLSGQSNMELPVIRTYNLNKEEIESADYPYVRQYRLTPDLEIPFKGDESICELPEAAWVKATGTGKYEISAIGFYAAKRLFEKNSIPVGLILNAQGGANIESFMCEEDLFATGTTEDMIAPFRGKGVLKSYVEEGNKLTVDWRSATEDKDFSLDASLTGAKAVKLPGIVVTGHSGSVWFTKEFELKQASEGECMLVLGDLIDADITFINGNEVGRTEYQYPPRKYAFDGSILKAGKNTVTTRLIVEHEKGGFVPGHPYYLKTPFETVDMTGEWKMVFEKKMPEFIPHMMAQNVPSSLYYASIATLGDISISQIWWCQGESNAGDPEGYEKKEILCFGKMREILGDVPLILVRIADYINPLTGETEIPDGWKKIQEIQDNAPSYLDKVKVVRSPAPDPIHELHPQNKSQIGADVAKAALEFLSET